MRSYHSNQALTDDWYEFWGYPYNKFTTLRASLEDKFQHQIHNLHEIIGTIDVSHNTIPFLISNKELQQIKDILNLNFDLFDKFRL
ncbi:MAG: hypothetical protein ABIJ08_04105, partial [Nanoarchaeota archaeon]